MNCNNAVAKNLVIDLAINTAAELAANEIGKRAHETAVIDEHGNKIGEIAPTIKSKLKLVIKKQ